MSDLFRLALWQGKSPSGDEEVAFGAVEKVLSAAAAMGANLAVFPEAYLLGYNAGQMVAQTLDGDWMRRLGALARQSGVGIVMGLSERGGEGCFNTACRDWPGRNAAGVLPESSALGIAREVNLVTPARST